MPNMDPRAMAFDDCKARANVVFAIALNTAAGLHESDRIIGIADRCAAIARRVGAHHA